MTIFFCVCSETKLLTACSHKDKRTHTCQQKITLKLLALRIAICMHCNVWMDTWQIVAYVPTKWHGMRTGS